MIVIDAELIQKMKRRDEVTLVWADLSHMAMGLRGICEFDGNAITVLRIPDFRIIKSPL